VGSGFALLLLVAAGLRYWHLWDIPSPTDELLNVARGLAVARGEILPLTDEETYIGSLWNYLTALPFLLFGPSEYVGRSLPFIAGVLTVPVGYLLAREMAGPIAGWLAAILLATSSAHILASSHPAWSHSLAPLFGTLALWQLQRSLRLGEPRGLLACGLWLGVALQVHLTMLALLPGVLAYFWLKGRHWLRTPWPYLSGLLAVLLIANVIVYNLQTGLDTVRRVQTVRASHAGAKGQTGLELYFGNLGRMGITSIRTLSGAIDIRERPGSFLADPLLIGPNLLMLAGALLLLRRGNPLPILAILPYAGLLALFNGKYEAIPNARFLTPLAPLAFACGGALGASVVQAAGARKRRLAGAAVALATAGLAAISLTGLVRRYEQMEGSAQATAMLYAAVDEIEKARQPGEAVLLDRNLDKIWLDGGGDLFMAFRFELTRRGASFGELPGRVVPQTGDTNSCDRQQVLAVRVDRGLETPVWLQEAINRDPSQVPARFWTFRVVPRSARSETLAASERLVFEYRPPLNGSARAVDRCSPGRQI
jgi:4-amino-4-deoxy-L-arabinose transferase-like glycosyltransferase